MKTGTHPDFSVVLVLLTLMVLLVNAGGIYAAIIGMPVLQLVALMLFMNIVSLVVVVAIKYEDNRFATEPGPSPFAEHREL